MSIQASSLVARVSVDGAEDSERKLEHVGKTSDSVGSHIGGMLAGAAAIGGVALIGLGEHAVSMAGSFQESMTQLVTGAGESEKNLGMVSQGVLDMSVQVGTATDQLAAGMYMIESSGQHGAAGLTVLRAAAEGAKVGNADLQTTAFALTNILHDYGLAADQYAVPATNALIAVTAAGKMHMQDLAGSLGNVLPIASQLKISFPEVGGAIAMMTNSGMSADRATQDLNHTLTALATPMKSAIKNLGEVGLTADDVTKSLSQQGLAGTLQMIEEHVAVKFPAGSFAYNEAMKKILGGQTGWATSLMLTGQNMKGFQENIASVKAAMDKGATSVTGWALVQDDFNQKMDQARAVVNRLFIDMGSQALPVIGGFVDQVTGAFQQVSDSAQQETLKTQISTIDNTTQMAQTNIGVWQSQKDAIVKQMEETKSGAVRQALDTKLQTLTQWQQQAEGVIADAKKQKDGVLQQLAQIDPAVRVQQLATKATSIQTSLEQAQGVADAYEKQRQDIEQQMLRTHDSVARHALAIKLTAISSAEEQAQGTVKSLLKQQADVAGQLTGAQSDANNPFTKLVTWVTKTGLPELQKFGDWFVKTALPNIQSLGEIVLKNLLPPVGSLITNVVTLGEHFATWLETSGTLKEAITSVSTILGTLVGWVAGFVDALNTGNPVVWGLVDVLGAVGAAIATLKVADMVAQFANWASDIKGNLAKELDKLAKENIPNLRKAWVEGNADMKKSTDETKASVKDVATETTNTQEVVKTETALMDADVAAVGTTAQTTATEVTTIGAEATSAETEVATASTSMEGDLAGVGTAATTAAGESGIGAIGPATTAAEGEVAGASEGMTGSFAGVAGTGGVGLIIGAIPLIGIGIWNAAKDVQNATEQMIQNVADFQKSAHNAGQDFFNMTQNVLDQINNANSDTSQLSYDIGALDNPHGAGGHRQIPTHAFGTSFAPGGPSLLGELEPEIVMGPTVANIGRGSQVIPFSQMRGGGSGGGYGSQEVHVHVHVAGHQVVDAILPDLATALRSGLGTVGI